MCNNSDPFGLCVWDLCIGEAVAVNLAYAALATTVAAAYIDITHKYGQPSTWFSASSNTGETGASGVALEQRRSGRSLKAEWEELHGKSWSEGCVAHHMCPLGDGGADHAGNIEPKTPEDHVQGHKDNGDFKRWGARSKKDPPKDPEKQPESSRENQR